MAVPRLKAVTAEPQPVLLGRPRTVHLRRDLTLRRALGAGDIAGVFLALALALALSGRIGQEHRLLWALAVLPLLTVVFKLYGLYDRDVKRISHSTVDDVPWLLHATLVGTLLVWLYSKVTPMHQLDFVEIVLFGAFTFTFVAIGRFGVRQAISRLLEPEPALLAAVAERYNATRVIVSPAGLEEDELRELLLRCRERSLKLSLLPQLSDVLGPAVEIDDVEGVTVLGVNPPWLPRSSRAMKRAMDIALAAVMLILLAPLMVLVAIAVKLDTPGPVLFMQERVGRGGRRFRLLKFRTMVADAEERRAELLALSTDPNWLKIDNDPRISRVGRRLRHLSIDELPQLWNVVRGEMSMVGPRPLIVQEDDMVQGWGRGRLDLTPGITGYWQVLGRTRIPFDEMVKLDYLYVMNWSLWTDLRLIMRTVPIVLSRRGAN